jgi:hypothetical protein
MAGDGVEGALVTAGDGTGEDATGAGEGSTGAGEGTAGAGEGTDTGAGIGLAETTTAVGGVTAVTLLPLLLRVTSAASEYPTSAGDTT